MMRALRSVPNLVMAQRVLDKMAVASRHYIEDETGEAMVGLIAPGTHTNGIPTLYVLDTISPDSSARSKWQTSGFFVASSWKTQLSASIAGAPSTSRAVRAS